MARIDETLRRLRQTSTPEEEHCLLPTQRTQRAYLLFIQGNTIPMAEALEVGDEPPLYRTEGDDTTIVYELVRQQAREAIFQGTRPNNPVTVMY